MKTSIAKERVRVVIDGGRTAYHGFLMRAANAQITDVVVTELVCIDDDLPLVDLETLPN